MTAHNLAAGFYHLDHTTGEVVGGPFSSRNQAVFEYRSENSPGAFVVLEVVGDVVPWLGGAVGNVCVDAETAACCDEDGPFNLELPLGYADRIENGDTDEADANEG